MARIVMWNLVTLDGFFEAAKKWDLGFHELVWGEELERFSIEQLGSAGALIFGRATYEGMAGYWSTAKGEVAELMNAIPKFVFSRSLGKAEWNNTRLLAGEAGEAAVRLKQEEAGDMLVFGSAGLSRTLMERGLFDEYRLCLVPVVLGSGTPLFTPAQSAARMDLVEGGPSSPAPSSSSTGPTESGQATDGEPAPCFPRPSCLEVLREITLEVLVAELGGSGPDPGRELGFLGDKLPREHDVVGL